MLNDFYLSFFYSDVDATSEYSNIYFPVLSILPIGSTIVD